MFAAKDEWQDGSVEKYYDDVLHKHVIHERLSSQVFDECCESHHEKERSFARYVMWLWLFSPQNFHDDSFATKLEYVVDKCQWFFKSTDLTGLLDNFGFRSDDSNRDGSHRALDAVAKNWELFFEQYGKNDKKYSLIQIMGFLRHIRHRYSKGRQSASSLESLIFTYVFEKYSGMGDRIQMKDVTDMRLAFFWKYRWFWQLVDDKDICQQFQKVYLAPIQKILTEMQSTIKWFQHCGIRKFSEDVSVSAFSTELSSLELDKADMVVDRWRESVEENQYRQYKKLLVPPATAESISDGAMQFLKHVTNPSDVENHKQNAFTWLMKSTGRNQPAGDGLAQLVSCLQRLVSGQMTVDEFNNRTAGAVFAPRDLSQEILAVHKLDLFKDIHLEKSTLAAWCQAVVQSPSPEDVGSNVKWFLASVPDRTDETDKAGERWFNWCAAILPVRFFHADAFDFDVFVDRESSLHRMIAGVLRLPDASAHKEKVADLKQYWNEFGRSRASPKDRKRFKITPIWKELDDFPFEKHQNAFQKIDKEISIIKGAVEWLKEGNIHALGEITIFKILEELDILVTKRLSLEQVGSPVINH